MLPEGKGGCDEDLDLMCLECVVDTGMKLENLTVRKSHTGTPRPKPGPGTLRDQVPNELETMKSYVAE